MVDVINPDEAPYRDIIGYFKPQVLAQYHYAPDKWVVETDYFEGSVRITRSYFEMLDPLRTEQSITLRFGYRTFCTGDLAIAVWLPDLFKKSESHVPLWKPYWVETTDWAEEDERFQLWLRRYMAGDWEVDNGAGQQVIEMLQIISGLTTAKLGLPLFKYTQGVAVSFPSAENTYAYEDAHRVLYGIVVDGLQLDTIHRLAERKNLQLSITSESRTVAALQKVVPSLATGSSYDDAIARISTARRSAAHGIRAPAERIRAFERFSTDLSLLLVGLRDLLDAVAAVFNTNRTQVTDDFHSGRIREPDPCP